MTKEKENVDFIVRILAVSATLIFLLNFGMGLMR